MDDRLTISAIEAVWLKYGCTPLTPEETEEEPAMRSSVTFKKDLMAQRDMEIREEVLQEIMQNRGVSRTEAERIMANPF